MKLHANVQKACSSRGPLSVCLSLTVENQLTTTSPRKILRRRMDGVVVEISSISITAACDHGSRTVHVLTVLRLFVVCTQLAYDFSVYCGENQPWYFYCEKHWIEPLTLPRPLLPWVNNCKASCTRPGQAVICNFWYPGTLTLNPERQSAQMSKITNDGLTRSGTGCVTAVPIRQQWAWKG